MEVQTIVQVGVGCLLLGPIIGVGRELCQRARGPWGWRSITALEIECGIINGLGYGLIVAALWAAIAAAFLTTWS